MRLFIAINFNDYIKNELCSVMENLKKYTLRGRFTSRENLHLTIVFIGETNKVEAVKKAMDNINATPFELHIHRLGKFSRRGGDIYWMGVENNDTLFSIYEQLTAFLSQSGFQIEERPYRPHVTLGREIILEKNSKGKISEENVPYLKIKVEKISLMKSERIAGKVVYTEIYIKML